jgi:hypothetical protein
MQKLTTALRCLVVLGAGKMSAATISCSNPAIDAISCTGSLSNPEDFVDKAFSVTSPGISTVIIQTFGFGGGTNAARAKILAGGFDSLVGLFTASPETILTDTSGNPLASVPGSTQFSSGCGSASTVTIGGTTVCGDNRLTVSLGAGAYTLLLSDANYIPYAISPGPPVSMLLSDGFADFTGGVFQTCTSSGACVADTGNFAVDTVQVPAPTAPEPQAIHLVGFVLIPLILKKKNPMTRF